MVTMQNTTLSSKKQDFKHGNRAPACEAGRCPMREAVQFLAGAWTLEIYWNLRQGKLRFGQLRRQLVSVSPKVLTERLRDLEDLGVVHREVLPTSPPQVEYSLTDLGRSFLPAIDMIAELGKKMVRKSKRVKQ